MTDTMTHSVSFDSPRPPLADDGDVPYPEAPTDLASTGIDELLLRDLALKLAYTVPQLTTEWAAERLRLPIPIMESLCQGLHRDKLLDILGPSGPACYRYAITQRGSDRAGRLMEISAYVGPAPVSIDAYRQVTVWQLERRPTLTPSAVVRGMSGIVLDESDMEVVALAVSSRKSLFLYGPPGNGKTTLGNLIHSTIRGDLWIPYCIQVESSIIQLYDPQCHKLSKELPDPMASVDERWVRIQPPFVLVGGELNIEQLDLAYSPSHRFYHAPLHLKANGGVYMIDDFGRQRVDTTTLLNRWIMPLESGEDHLTLRTGQQIQVPFLQMLIIATNLEPDRVMNASFLRRMGYRLCLPSPTPERFKKIVEEYVAKVGKAIPDGLVEKLLTRYRNEHRHFQACEARDLIERARDICRFRDKPLELSEEVMDLAWRSYFGRKDAEARRA